MVSFTTFAAGLVAIFASSAMAAPTNAAAAASGPSAGLGACGQLHQDSEFVVALSHADFDPQTPGGNPNNNPLCGRRLRASFEGKSVKVAVIDRCPACSAGSLDLSPAAFSQLADLGRGRIQGSWVWL
ncbi:uncharacterized protein PODANS_5_460 [Podospora anserina S mat+]|uniref:Podospora anserina S mat+ genomic DNA chromosome 5, supercontig 1 n=1 Tax=Podospora anserina (strain S / ATCC MYA-4624 / DSM 980 / FGSC 10383) TaxID=515849 RepID=B2AF59_PODAN|nr:uncharacterized protein PODANS_5_460 [Podospora anserina S mat+]CAP62076.1 unnamed protein product [Podospora anserina S mat+]CDP29151.1 Putative protein of unknown function [Podospora anserina S mat+]